MTPEYWDICLLAFFAVAVGYALISSLTPLLYKNKSWGQLTANELRVKQGTATPEIRLNLFVRSFFSCFFTYQIYLAALVLSGAILLLWKTV